VPKPVVLIAEELSPATIEALGPDFEVRFCNGADRKELLSAITDVDAILIRSATKVDAEALAAAVKLQVIARAGVGLDNVDVPAATQAGVMVVNAPTSNIVSAAELAVALLLATARHISQASASLRAGQWKRSSYTGAELFEKTLGVVGLGRIGVLVAQRLAAFGMDIVAYDPYVSTARAGQLGVRLVGLEELLAVSDFITVHLPKTPETVGLIGEPQLRLVKPTVRIVNAARGGIVDEWHRSDGSRHIARPLRGRLVEAGVGEHVGQRDGLAGRVDVAHDALRGRHADADGACTLCACSDPELKAIGIMLEECDGGRLGIEEDRGRVYHGLKQGRLGTTLQMTRDSSTPRRGLEGLQRGGEGGFVRHSEPGAVTRRAKLPG
jgi:phosphoglycerate dehydrogenase-like enzyme